MTHLRSEEAETYASTTASPPPVQISLDDSLDTEYKESHFLNGSGLITPGTDFSEEVRASYDFRRVCVFVGLTEPYILHSAFPYPFPLVYITIF